MTGLLQHGDVAVGEDAGLGAVPALPPVVVDAPRQHHHLSFLERQFEIRLRCEVELRPSLSF